MRFERSSSLPIILSGLRVKIMIAMINFNNQHRFKQVRVTYRASRIAQAIPKTTPVDSIVEAERENKVAAIPAAKPPRKPLSGSLVFRTSAL